MNRASTSSRLLPLLTRTRRLIRTSEAGFILLAVIAGICAGLLAAALGGIAHLSQQLLFGFSAGARLSAMNAIAPLRLLALPLGGALLALFTLWIGRRSRAPVDVVEANALHGGRIPLRDSLTVSAQTLLSNGTGASVGLEAAYAQMGGGFASILGQWLNLRRADLRTLVGAGAGAAVGAAFGAPLTGAFYAFEIVIGAYTPASIAPVAAACLAAVITARSLGATPYLIAAAGSQAIHTLDYLFYALLGIIAAFAGIGIMRLITLVEAAVRRSPLPDPARPIVGGLLMVPIAWLSPQALSAGHGALHLDIMGQFAIAALLLMFALKVLASTVSLGFGFRGGLFFASLFLGTLLGQIFAQGVNMIAGIPLLAAADAALVGMAALAVAVVGGPMTMSLLVLEATHDFSLTATVVTATLCASAVVREGFGYSFSTWRLHLRGEAIRSARDIGWVRTLTAGRMMRPDPPTIREDASTAAFRATFPLGSTSRVLLTDAQGRYAGMVPTAAAYAEGLAPDAPVAGLAILRDAHVTAGTNVAAVTRRFEELGADDIAIVSDEGLLLGVLTEKYVQRRYAAELEKAQRELFGE